MKRILILFCIAAMLLSLLCACGPNTESPSEPSTDPAKTGQDVCVSEVVEEAAPLVITEVMPDNRNLVLGLEQDWVELYNPEETPVSLDGYALTDDLSKPAALPLAGKQIPAEGYLIVTLEDGGPLGLSETGETIYLTYRKNAISSLTFGAAQGGASFDPEGVCPFPTPGYANTEEGYYAYLDSQPLPELTINEVMSANGAYYPAGGVYYDLVEVRNTSGQDIPLKNYYLTDKWDGDDRYYFPDITLAPGELYVVLCSGNAAAGGKHAPFSLAPGDTVYLAKNGVYVDTLSIPADLQYNESYGRSGNTPVYLSKPTPGADNTEGYLTGIAAPAASLAPGQYDEPVSISLTGSGTIYYTTNGSRPTTGSRVYTAPITVDGVTTIRAISVDGSRKSPVANFTYVIGKEHDLPIVVVSIPQSSLSGDYGLHTFYLRNYEYEAVMTLFENGEEQFTIPFGLALHGNDSRRGKKKNYKVRFRAEYGASKLNYHLFDNRDIDEFNSLLLKGGSEDWHTAMMRDELATSIADGTTALYTQAMKPVVLYLGGEYWGIYYFRERFSQDYVASHMNVSPQSADIAYSSAGATDAGTVRDYHIVRRNVRSMDMSTNESFAYLCQNVDINSLMDWYICRTYMVDEDLGNIRRFRSKEADGKWHWMYFDLDWSFYIRVRNPVSRIISMPGGEHQLIQAVLKSEAGRDAFLKRYAYLMDTVLNEEFIIARIDAIAAAIESEIPADRARWFMSVSAWERNVERLRKFARQQEQIVLNDLKDYFSLSSSQMEYYFGCLDDEQHPDTQ